MKRLVLVRHAKSSWKDSELSDHDRPLNKRGERDAAFMSKVFRKKKIKVDAIFSSTALRAITTAKEFAHELDFGKGEIIQDKSLYLAEASELLEYTKSVNNNFDTVMIFGHNPGITWFATQLSGSNIENISTCGITAIEFNINSWDELNYGLGKLLFFEYPKMYFKDSDD